MCTVYVQVGILKSIDRVNPLVLSGCAHIHSTKMQIDITHNQETVYYVVVFGEVSRFVTMVAAHKISLKMSLYYCRLTVLTYICTFVHTYTHIFIIA